MKHLLSLSHLSYNQIEKIIEYAFEYKMGSHLMKYLTETHTLALIFEKKSTRTRLSCEIAWGGKTIFLNKNDIHMGVNESVEDTIRVMSDMVSCIVARVHSHTTLIEMQKYSTVPIINGLSDKFHPLQILADLMTIIDNEKSVSTTEKEYSSYLNCIKVTWLGDINNVCNSLMTTLPRFGMHLTVCHPKEYQISQETFKMVHCFCKSVTYSKDYVHPPKKMLTSTPSIDGSVHFTHDPIESLDGAQYIFIDTWISMGQEDEKKERLVHFAEYKLTQALVDKSNVHPDWKMLHCLPHKKEEVDDDIFYSDRSLAWKEAKNRLYTMGGVYKELFS